MSNSNVEQVLFGYGISRRARMKGEGKRGVNMVEVLYIHV
jgi:hypothetical protein